MPITRKKSVKSSSGATGVKEAPTKRQLAKAKPKKNRGAASSTYNGGKDSFKGSKRKKPKHRTKNDGQGSISTKTSCGQGTCGKKTYSRSASRGKTTFSK